MRRISRATSAPTVGAARSFMTTPIGFAPPSSRSDRAAARSSRVLRLVIATSNTPSLLAAAATGLIHWPDASRSGGKSITMHERLSSSPSRSLRRCSVLLKRLRDFASCGTRIRSKPRSSREIPGPHPSPDNGTGLEAGALRSTSNVERPDKLSDAAIAADNDETPAPARAPATARTRTPRSNVALQMRSTLLVQLGDMLRNHSWCPISPHL